MRKCRKVKRLASLGCRTTLSLMPSELSSIGGTLIGDSASAEGEGATYLKISRYQRIKNEQIVGKRAAHG